jgi:hypothetical protein
MLFDFHSDARRVIIVILAYLYIVYTRIPCSLSLYILYVHLLRCRRDRGSDNRPYKYPSIPYPQYASRRRLVGGQLRLSLGTCLLPSGLFRISSRGVLSRKYYSPVRRKFGGIRVR